MEMGRVTPSRVIFPMFFTRCIFIRFCSLLFSIITHAKRPNAHPLGALGPEAGECPPFQLHSADPPNGTGGMPSADSRPAMSTARTV
ncbi:hypothetical protein SAMN05421790_108134 [Kroppenstedtia eburnea]|uniref:Uncharacterized protein n=1 Tax=Kroppenstedtia eburnea TaxID=714067 RepID=A0A1N7ND17_9BACL|nr:hypothetical protein SAMN05421790_108134 [Kroppenstedtia eburnea]